MKICVLGDKTTMAYTAACEVVVDLGHIVCEPHDTGAHLAIAPLLTLKISNEEINRPMLGTLIFHPSPLPWGRGASSIKWAYKRAEPITGATWFWANERYDAGDICEQEIVTINYVQTPRAFYEAHIIPAMVRTLRRALVAIEWGYIRRIPQVEEYSSYD